MAHDPVMASGADYTEISEVLGPATKANVHFQMRPSRSS